MLGSQQKLEELIEALLKDECQRHNVAPCALYTLETIYLTDGQNNGFKHHYSGISQVLFTASRKSAREDTYFPEALPYLSSTINDIISIVANENSPQHNPHLVKMLQKLHDHIELEVLRINYSAEMNLNQEDKLGSLSSQIKQHHTELVSVEQSSKDLETSITKAHIKLQNAQKDYIAILAIFSAVIVAFSGGFSFIANSFSGISDIDLDKLLCLASFVGVILIDLIYFLLRFVWGIIRPDTSKERIPGTILPLAVVNILFIVSCIYFYSLSTPISTETLEYLSADI